MRVLIAGGPKSGKTTLAERLHEEKDIALIATDDLIGKVTWDEVPDRVLNMMDRFPTALIVEGVQVPRIIRRAMSGALLIGWVDQVIYLHTEFGHLTARQAGMRKAVETVWSEVEPSLVSADIPVVHLFTPLQLRRYSL